MECTKEWLEKRRKDGAGGKETERQREETLTAGDLEVPQCD
jgi:hypothetical protein